MVAAGIPDCFSRYRDAIIAEMHAVVGDQGALLYRIMRYHLGWQEPDGRAGPGHGGKAIRPALCLLAYEGTSSPPVRYSPSAPDLDRTGVRSGADPSAPTYHSALPAAAAIELVHNFSLVHDDIEDRDLTRHGRPTVWSLWGEAQGINAGDGLWALATRALLRLAERGVLPAIVVRAHTMLNDACLTMIEGQALDLAFEGRDTPVTVDEYLDMIARKTGALIATALAIGALIGSGDEEVAAAYHHFGRLLGRSFQIQDDILGIWGEGSVTGKSTSSDIRRRKQSYPIVYTLTQGPPAARAALAAVYAQPEIDDDGVEHAVAALNEAGAREQAAALVNEAHTGALRLLERLPVRPDIGDDLREIAGFLLRREF